MDLNATRMFVAVVQAGSLPLPEWSINLLYPPQRHRSTIVRAYLDFCQSYLPKIVQACEIDGGMG